MCAFEALSLYFMHVSCKNTATMANITLDSFDTRILSALQRDGRLTNAELSEAVGLSASQCSRRRSALEASGAIARYAALLSPGKVGLGLTAFVEVTLHAHSEERSRRFAQLVDRLDEVQEAHSLTGDTDYLLKLAVQDLSALSQILNHVLLAHESVARIRSSIVLERLKDTPELPLGHLG